MSLRNSFSNAATSWTLCSSSKWTSHPRSNSLRSWKRFSYTSNPHQRWTLLGDMRLPRWTPTCRTRFLELPTRKIPTVCSPKSRCRFSLSASTLVCFQYLWIVYKELQGYMFCFCSTNVHGFFPNDNIPCCSRCWQQSSTTCGTCL